MTASKKVLVSLSIAVVMVILVSLIGHLQFAAAEKNPVDMLAWGTVIDKRFNDTISQCQVRLDGVSSVDSLKWLTSSDYRDADFCKLVIGAEVKIFQNGGL